MTSRACLSSQLIINRSKTSRGRYRSLSHRKEIPMDQYKSLASILTLAPSFGVFSSYSFAQQLPLAPGVEKLCSTDFNKDSRRPARVEDGALPCLEQSAKKLRDTPGIKLVLVGNSHPLYDHEDQDHGMEREGEDKTGLDIRFTDVAGLSSCQHEALSHPVARCGRNQNHPYHRRIRTRQTSNRLCRSRRCLLPSQLHSNHSNQ